MIYKFANYTLAPGTDWRNERPGHAGREHPSETRMSIPMNEQYHMCTVQAISYSICVFRKTVAIRGIEPR